MILAAGLGTRMKPLTDRLPKPLLPVAGYPLIAYPLGLLKAAGITDVVVNIHHLGHLIEKQLAGCADEGMNITFSRETSLLETGGGIARAAKLIGDDTFVVLNADAICDIDLREVIEDHHRYNAIATMVLRKNPDTATIPIVEWDSNSRHVVDIRSELGVKYSYSLPLMFTGIHIFGPDVFDYLIPMRESVIDGFYLPAIRENRHIHGYVFDGYWEDIGTLDRYERARAVVSPTSLQAFQPLNIPTVDLA